MNMLKKVFVVTTLLTYAAGAYAVDAVLSGVINDTGRALYLKTEAVPGSATEGYVSGARIEPQEGVIKKVNIPLDFTQGNKAQFVIDDGINKDNKLRLVVLKYGNKITASLLSIGYFTEPLGETKTFDIPEQLFGEEPINLVIYVKGVDLKGSFIMNAPRGEYKLELTK